MFSLRLSLSFSAIAAGLLCAQVAGAGEAESQDAAQNWPQWRGPDATGVSTTANPPTEWSEEKNIRWKVKIPGEGLSTPIVWGDRVFIQTAIPTGKKVEEEKAEEKKSGGDSSDKNTEKEKAEKSSGNPPLGDRPRWRGMQSVKPTEIYQFVLLCLDRRTGKTLWQKVAREELPHEGYHAVGEGSFASGSPVTDGQLVFAYFGSRGLYCYDMQGNLKWEKDLGKMKVKLGFGEGSSPALYGNTLVVTWDHEGADDFIVAFKADTGDELWRVPRKSETVWATPLVVEVNGRPQVVASGMNKICSYDLETGKVVWECKGLTANPIPSPVAADGIVYLTSGYRGSALLAIKLDGDGDLIGTESIAWSYNKDTPYVPSPLLYDNRLYMTKVNTGMLTCLNAKTGESLYSSQRVEGLESVYASPVAAAGRIYFVDRDGTTVVLRSGDELEVLATNKLDDAIDASPALVGNEMLLRGKEYLYCIAENESRLPDAGKEQQ